MPSDAMRVWRKAAWAAREEGEGDEDKRELLGAAVIERAIADAVEQERARICAWLEEGGQLLDFNGLIRKAIERGDHKERQDG